MTIPSADHGSPAPAARIQVLIADDDRGVREALSELIADDPGLELVAAVADAYAAIAFVEMSCPDIAVIDLVMPGGGVHATRRILELCPSTRVIGLSSFGDRVSVASMLDAGALRYVVKGAAGGDVVSAILEVAAGTGGGSPAVI